MYKLVLFDLDGTILNTVPDIKRVLNDALTHFGLPTVDDNNVKAFVGNGAYMLVKRACGRVQEDLVKKVYAYYSKNFALCDNAFSAYYRGEEKALKKLKDNDIKMGIITNKPHAATLNVYEKFFKKYGFVFVQGHAEGVPLKPAPDSLLRALYLNGIARSECLFVGDGETDVETAKNAGVDGVAALWGYRTKACLEEAGATAFVRSFDELVKLVLKSD